MKNLRQQTLVFNTPTEFKNYLKGVEVMPTAFNRAIKSAHSDKMAKSIKTIKVQRAINIIKTSAFGKEGTSYIADGQHLRDAILNTRDKDLGNHLVVFINEIDEVQNIIPFVSRMNATAKNWTRKNYLDAWTTQGVSEYKFLTNKLSETDYSLSILLEAYGLGGVSKQIEDFKNGLFKIEERKGGMILRAYEKACSVGLYRSTSSALATARFFWSQGQLAEEIFVEMVSKNSNTFKHKLNRDGYLGLFKSFLPKKY